MLAAAYFVLAASALTTISAVSVRPSGPTEVKYEESELLGQADDLTVLGAVQPIKGDDERTMNLKYVLAIQNSSIWTDIKRRSLTISTDPRLAQILEMPPQEQCDCDLALLKRLCNDALKCVAVDQLLVLQSVTQTLGDGTTVVSVRRAITKITHVLTEYTTEYHEDAYQYVEVAETDDPQRVSQAVTVMVQDNKELCKLELGDDSVITENETVSTVVSRDDRNQVTGEIVVSPVNKGNVATTATQQVPQGKQGDSDLLDSNRVLVVPMRRDDPQASERDVARRGAVPVSSSGQLLRVKIRSNPDDEIPKSGGDRKSGARPSAHEHGSIAETRKPDTGSISSRDSHDEALIKARLEKLRDRKTGTPKPAHVKYPYQTDASTNTLNSKSNNENTGNSGNNFVSFATGNGGGGGAGGNDEDTDIVSVGDRNEGHVKKGYVEDGVINNGDMNLYNLNSGTYTKGVVDKSGSGRGGIINVGTLNNGPTNYGKSRYRVNYGTESTLNDNNIVQYLSSIDKMYSSVIDGLSQK